MSAIKNGCYQISEVCRITGLSRDTLHFYMKSGLLTPDYVDPENHYSYFSRWNMYQLDIIITCRNLGVPLEKVRKIIRSGDNEQVVQLLGEYRGTAAKRAEYYARVVADIDWYQEESRHALTGESQPELMIREAETILAAEASRTHYHANMQRLLIRETPLSVRRNYGYFLDRDCFLENRLQKYREYVTLPDQDYSAFPEENLCTMPKGLYAVQTLCIRDEETDFRPLLQLIQEAGCRVEQVYAQELGFQMFQYIHQYYCTIYVYLSR